MSVETKLPSRQTGNQRGVAKDRQSFSRYDMLLAAIPVPFVLGTATALLTEAPTAGGVAGGGVVAALLVFYGLFVDPPVDG